MSGLSIAKTLELHLLSSMITREEVAASCERAAELHLASVCVWPVHVATASTALAGSDTRTCAAIGYPWGHEHVETRLVSIERALVDGAAELAVALDHSALLAGDVDRARSELDRLLSSTWWTSLVSSRGRGELSICIETMLLDVDALRPLLAAMHDSPAGFLRTGSGHHARTVTEDHVRHLRELLPADIGITAVGGVATLGDALGMAAAGAVRVGTASAVAVLEQERRAAAARRSGQVR